MTAYLYVGNPEDDFAWYMEHRQVASLNDQESRQVDFQVQEPAIAHGRVIDSSGNPIPYANVSAFHEVTNFRYGYGVTAGDDGRFTIYLAPGKHELWVEAPGRPEVMVYACVSVQPGQELPLNDIRFEPERTDAGCEPSGDGGDQEPGQPGDSQPPDDDGQQGPGNGNDGSPQPGPGTPPPAPVPHPEQPRSGDRVVDRATLEDLLTEQPGDAPLTVEAELGKRVAFHADAFDTLKEAGKPAVTLNFGGPSLYVPLANLDPRELVNVNAALKDVLDDEGLEIRYTVKAMKQDELPAGLQAGGDAYDIALSVYSPAAGEVRLARLAAPVTLSLPFTIDVSDPSLVAVWQLRDDGSATPVPSWVTGENKVSASLTHFSKYVTAVRQPAFTDTRGHWAEKEIGIAYSHGIVNGKKASVFAPDVPVTRAEFVAMLARTLGLEPDAAAAARFKDVPAGSWYAGVVGAAVKSGIAKGTTDTTFSPGARLTRLELAVLIGRALKAQGYKLEGTPDKVLAPFRDAKDVGTWAREDLALAVQSGVVKGVTSTILAPDATATRAQVAAMLVRYLDYVFTTGE